MIVLLFHQEDKSIFLISPSKVKDQRVDLNSNHEAAGLLHAHKLSK